MRELGAHRTVAFAFLLALVSALTTCGDNTPSEAAPDLDPGNRADAATGADLTSAADQARAAIEAYVEAINVMDFDSAGTFYSESPDFQWIEDGAIRYRSARESRESLAGLGAMASLTELTVSDLSVTALGSDAAVATCHFVQAIGVEGGPGFAFAGALTMVLRNEDGRWLFVSGHTSSARLRPDGAAIGEPGGRP